LLIPALGSWRWAAIGEDRKETHKIEIMNASAYNGRGHVKRDMIDVDTSRASEEGAHSPSWPNGLILLLLFLD
jgi:hypothetical protein